MEKLSNLILEIESKIEFRNSKNISVSKSDVAWHLDHVLRVTNGIASIVLTSKPEDYENNFNIKRSLIFLIGKMPRGKARAPKTVVSDGEITLSDLQSKVERAKSLLHNFHYCTSQKHFRHPYFGSLNLKQTIRFLEIHTKHHLKIVDDILK
jgi:hypothetical protein